MANKNNLRKRIDEEKQRLEQLWVIKQGIEQVFMDVAKGLDLLLNDYDKVMKKDEGE
jgi:uncharacterized membrane-anchored protein YhcB (DUF1043 family)